MSIKCTPDISLSSPSSFFGSLETMGLSNLMKRIFQMPRENITLTCEVINLASKMISHHHSY